MYTNLCLVVFLQLKCLPCADFIFMLFTFSCFLSIQSNDVNQGDALEHDFSTIHTTLTFPVKHITDNTLIQVCLLFG